MTRLIHRTVVTVPSTRLMTDDTFIKHMNLRHADSIGGLHSLWLINRSVTGAWRAFHNRLHNSGTVHSHIHEDTL